MKIVIGSEGMGIWGKKFLNFLLKKIGYTNIEYKNIDNCDLIIYSFFLKIEKPWNKTNKKYIYWSGETHKRFEFGNNKYEAKALYILTEINNLDNYLYIPFCLDSSWIYKDRKYNDILERKYLIAYCHKNKVKAREDIFNLFVEKTNKNTCHSLSKCNGKYPKTNISKKIKILDDWDNSKLIDIYSQYKFVLAMENTCSHGYITEKIINAFYSGAIPIYWGSSNINDFFNEKAFINVNNFNSFEECVDYVISLDDETIKKMSQEPIYKDNDLINLFNEEYNNKYGNKVLDNYLNILKKFLS